MIKLVYCIVRHSEVSQGEFHRYWLEEHGPRVRGHAKAMNAVRYVQSHTLESDLNDGLVASRGCQGPYDGITEVWWQSEDEMRAALGTDAGREAGVDLLKDEARFIDLAASRVFMTEEHEIFDLRP